MLQVHVHIECAVHSACRGMVLVRLLHSRNGKKRNVGAMVVVMVAWKRRKNRIISVIVVVNLAFKRKKEVKCWKCLRVFSLKWHLQVGPFEMVDAFL